MRLLFALCMICATGCCCPCVDKYLVPPVAVDPREPVDANSKPDLNQADATTARETSVDQLAPLATASKPKSRRVKFLEEFCLEILFWGPFIPFWGLMGWCPD